MRQFLFFALTVVERRDGNGTYNSHSVIKRQTCHQLRVQWTARQTTSFSRKYRREKNIDGWKDIFRYFANIALDGTSWSWWTRSISCHYYGLKRTNFIGNRYLKTEFQFRNRAKFNLKSFSLFQKSTSGHEFRENLNRGAEMLSMDWRDLPNSARVILFGKKWNGWRLFRNSNPPRELSPQTNLELNSQQNSRALPVSWIIILSSAVVTSLILNK